MMPVGVPRVPYKLPKEGSWQWIDLWNCMVRERTRESRGRRGREKAFLRHPFAHKRPKTKKNY
jgi:hypothetical protein